MANRALTLVDGWTLRETIGQGSMGKVKLATKEGAEMAVKIVAKPIEEHGADYMITTRDLSLLPFTPGTDRKSQANQRIVREIAFGLLLKHPSIVPCRHVTMTKEYYYIFFELVKGVQLLDFIISHGKLSEKMASRMMQQIISAVDYCHTYSVVHRDLKIENILVDKQGLIKLVDFGLANLYSSDRLLSTFCGSLYFASPELLNAKKYLGPEIDIWSIVLS